MSLIQFDQQWSLNKHTDVRAQPRGRKQEEQPAVCPCASPVSEEVWMEVAG